MPKNRISRRVADSDYEYFSPLGAALSRRSLARFFPQAYRCDPPSSSRDDKAAALGASRAHHALAHDGPPDDPTNQSSAMSALAASAAYAAPGAARALRRCAARARRELPAPRSPQKSLPGFLFRPTRGGARVPSRSRPLPRPDPPARASAASRRVPARSARAPRALPEAPPSPPARAAPRATPRGRVVGVVVPRIPRGAASRTLVARRSRRGGAPAAALPAPPPPWVPERTRSRRAIPDRLPDARLLSSRTRRTTTRRRGGAKRPDPPTFARTRQCTRLVLLGSNDVFHVLFFSFRSKCNAVQSPSSPPPVGPRRESSALRSPFASPR
jgi:hypothetical protein